ncbi:hypothetical protein PILCRDRAFT_824853 [Piloderma croceum F 1598]|uniref:Uncharacterized protein n=1 Tax=Piloderma croceum (strain F 1598) TaxID=765440 RepID=A0A0C3AD50_PILCF|nr:hypothetical protein PILCRDRAFT_830191 [Piloderma croceum F 1598]KIM77879.1 hypothetical protein PILCRDRAFT_824853 [Piloderma croceum F 1598]
MSMSGVSDFGLSEESDHSNLSYDGSHRGAGGIGLSMSIARNQPRSALSLGSPANSFGMPLPGDYSHSSSSQIEMQSFSLGVILEVSTHEVMETLALKPPWHALSAPSNVGDLSEFQPGDFPFRSKSGRPDFFRKIYDAKSALERNPQVMEGIYLQQACLRSRSTFALYIQQSFVCERCRNLTPAFASFLCSQRT